MPLPSDYNMTQLIAMEIDAGFTAIRKNDVDPGETPTYIKF